MPITPEREAELLSRLDEAGALPPLAKPKVVVRDDVVKRDANVRVSRADPNATADNDRLVEVRVKDLFAVPKAQRMLGVDEALVGGRTVMKGYWTLVDGSPCYVEVEKDTNRVVSEYNPFSKDRLP